MAKIANTEEISIPVEKSVDEKPKVKKECEDCKVLKQQVESLQKSFQLKSQEYNQLLDAYRALLIKYSSAGEAARTFARTLGLSIDLLFPIDRKGE